MGSKPKLTYFGICWVNKEYSNMVANILLADTPSIPRLWSKGQNFFFSESEPVARQIKEKEV